MRNDESRKWKTACGILSLLVLGTIGGIGVLLAQNSLKSADNQKLQDELAGYKNLTDTNSSDDLRDNVASFDMNLDRLYAEISNSLAKDYKSSANIQDLRTSEDKKYIVASILNYAGIHQRKTTYEIDTNIPGGLYFYRAVDSNKWERSKFGGSSDVKCSDLSEAEIDAFAGSKFGSEKKDLSCLGQDDDRLVISELK